MYLVCCFGEITLEYLESLESLDDFLADQALYNLYPMIPIFLQKLEKNKIE